MAYQVEVMAKTDAQEQVEVSLSEALSRVEEEGARGDALLAVINCRKALASAYAMESIDHQLRHGKRFRHIKAGEKACPWLTNYIMHSRGLKRSIDALKTTHSLEMAGRWPGWWLSTGVRFANPPLRMQKWLRHRGRSSRRSRS